MNGFVNLECIELRNAFGMSCSLNISSVGIIVIFEERIKIHFDFAIFSANNLIINFAQ
jgi:hypothetical protein